MSKIFYIHGGNTHSSQEKFYEYLENKTVELEKRESIWTDQLEANFPNHQIIRISMPNKVNADYKAWEIMFRKYTPHITSKDIIIGFSLGATFLLKFLSRNNLPTSPKQLVLVAGPIDSEGSPEELCNGFESQTTELNSKTLQSQSHNMHLFYATDDQVVPIIQMHKIQAHLPNAKFIELQNRGGHFITSDFPELVNLIKNA